MNVDHNMTLLFDSPSSGQVYNTIPGSGTGGTTTNTTPNTSPHITPNIAPNTTPREGTVPIDGSVSSSGIGSTHVEPSTNSTPEEETIQAPVHAAAAICSTSNNPTATSIVDIVTDEAERKSYFDYYNNMIEKLAREDVVDEELANQLWLSKYVRNDEVGAKEWQALYKVTNKLVQAKAIHYRIFGSTLDFVASQRKFDTHLLVPEAIITSHVDDCLGPQPKFGMFMDKAVEDFARANTLKWRLYHLFNGQLRRRFANKCPLVPTNWPEVANVVWDIFGLSEMVDKQMVKMVNDTIKHIIPRYPSFQLPMALDNFVSQWHDIEHIPFVKLLYEKADGLEVFLAAVLSGDSQIDALFAKQEYLANLPKITMSDLHVAWDLHERDQEE